MQKKGHDKDKSINKIFKKWEKQPKINKTKDYSLTNQ